MSADNPWTTLSTRLVYENPWLRVREDQVLNPSGNPGIYGVVMYRNKAVGVVPVDDDDHTWLVGQYRYPHHRYEWEIPEGGCPEGEEPVECAKRELLEETGLIAEHFELIGEMQLSNSTTDEVGYMFLARGITHSQACPEETEKLEVKRVPLEEAIRMVMDGEIRDSLSVAALLKIGMMRQSPV